MYCKCSNLFKDTFGQTVGLLGNRNTGKREKELMTTEISTVDRKCELCCHMAPNFYPSFRIFI